MTMKCNLVIITSKWMFKNNNKDKLVKLSFAFFHPYTFLNLCEMVKYVKYCGTEGVLFRDKGSKIL